MRERLERLRIEGTLAVQAGVAAGLAWLGSHDLLHHPRPFFAPISAVAVLVGAVGQRWRRALELVAGVALGIAIGDVIILLIGVGTIQIMVVVTLAILIAVLLNARGVMLSQTASSAVLVATLQPPQGGIDPSRLEDSLVGGAAAILVLSLLFPFNPLTRVRRAAEQSLSELAESTVMIARALTERDVEVARAALERLRGTENDQADLEQSLSVGQETVRLAPLRWHSRGALSVYVEAAPHLDRATRNLRVLGRRAVTTIIDDEPIPAQLPEAITRLGDALSCLRRDLDRGGEMLRTRDLGLGAVACAANAYGQGLGFSGDVVVAQVRSAVHDLLEATGLDDAQARAAVRAAAQ